MSTSIESSLRKPPYVPEYLLKKVRKYREEFEKYKKGLSKRPEAIKTKARESTILESFIGISFAVHKGNKFVEILINENMVGQKLGDFVLTRTFKGHSGNKIKSSAKGTKGKGGKK